MYKTGDIFNCTSKSIISKMIRWFTKSDYSHTAMFIEIWGQPFIIESQVDGVHIHTFDEWQKKYKYNYVVMRGDTGDEKEFSIRAMSLLGKKYDFKSLLLTQPIKLKTGIIINKKDGKLDSLFCSEFIAWCYKIDDFQMSPEDLFRWQIMRGFLKINTK